MNAALRVGVSSSIALVVLIMLVAAAIDAAGCSSGDVAVGSTEEPALQKNADGTPTGDGQGCSWDGTLSDSGVAGVITPGTTPSGPRAVGDTFRSPDGCNDCRCTAEGIVCTVRACPPAPTLPTCSSTSVDGRPSGTCAAGSICVFTDGSPACPPGALYRAACPNQYQCTCGASAWSCEIVAGCLGVVDCPGTKCAPDTMLCPDGGSVGRLGPDCAFGACP